MEKMFKIADKRLVKYRNSKDIYEVSIPDGIDTIFDAAFRNCTEIRHVHIPNSVKRISYNAFRGCTNLEDIIIPDSVQIINSDAFSFCDKLKSITIPKSVSNIGSSILAGCDDLETIKVDKHNKVYDSRNDCNAIIKTQTNELIMGCKNTIIPNSVTKLCYGAFDECEELESIVIPESVNCIEEYVFSGCKNLKHIEIPDCLKDVSNDFLTLYAYIEDEENCIKLIERVYEYKNRMKEYKGIIITYIAYISNEFKLIIKDKTGNEIKIDKNDMVVTDEISDIQYLLDTVKKRAFNMIEKNDDSIISLLNHITSFKLNIYIEHAQKVKAFNSLAILLDYKNKHFKEDSITDLMIE